MRVLLYRNSAPPNKVNKTANLSKEKEFSDVRFIEDGALDILNPSVLLRVTSDGDIIDIDSIAVYNYMYIPKFSRYYYIDSVSTEGGLIRINGRVDVLYSHMKDILSSKQYIMRQQTYNNSPYLEDNMLPIRSDHAYVAAPFGSYVDDRTCGRVILATTGKGGTIV